VLGERCGSWLQRDVEAWRGARTRTVDGLASCCCPLQRLHVHFVDGGLSLDSVQLNDASSAAEFAVALANKPERHQGRVGHEWRLDETKWTPAAMPTKELIDP